MSRELTELKNIRRELRRQRQINTQVTTAGNGLIKFILVSALIILIVFAIVLYSIMY